MELTDGGWYKTPRIIKGNDFLAHIHDTYASGNAMYVEFKASEGEVRINLEQFDQIWLDQTFQKLHPVIVNHDGKFWHVMGLKLDVDADGSFWGLYLKRQDSDFMKEIRMPMTQKFIYNPISGSWSLDDPTQEIKDLEEIKQTLRADAILDVTVSGVPMKLIRVQEIAKGVLFFVFQDEEKNKRYYYNRPAIKLRIVTDSETGEQKYFLDHIKAMYID